MAGMDAPVIRKAASNPDFARRVGIHFTTASRLRNGDRMPSVACLSRIITAFDLAGSVLEEFMQAAEGGAETLGAWINEHLFESADASE